MKRFSLSLLASLGLLFALMGCGTVQPPIDFVMSNQQFNGTNGPCIVFGAQPNTTVIVYAVTITRPDGQSFQVTALGSGQTVTAGTKINLPIETGTCYNRVGGTWTFRFTTGTPASPSKEVIVTFNVAG